MGGLQTGLNLETLMDAAHASCYTLGAAEEPASSAVHRWM